MAYSATFSLFTIIATILISTFFRGAHSLTWPCIAGTCPDGTTCPASAGGNAYGCAPPPCTADTDCEGLGCVLATGVCADNFPTKQAAGAACSTHAGCANLHLCEGDVCTKADTHTGSFEICSTDANCRISGDPITQNEICLKYKQDQQFSGVCVQPSSDPANTRPTPPPFGPNSDQSRNRATNCDQHRDLCNEEHYRQLMKEMCAMTCRDAGVNLQCIDNHPNCRHWVNNGFCEQSFYTSETKRQKCAKSCGLC